MKTKIIFAGVLFLAGIFLLWSQIPVSASPAPQVAYPSPTPGPDGRIIYIVKDGDTCEQLSILYGVSVDYIRTTNLLDNNCTLRAGKPIMLGIGGPSVSSPTPGPSPTATPVTPTPTVSAGGTASICVLIYDDANGDGLRQSTEGAIAGAAISLTSEDGTFSKTLTSAINPDATAYQGMCFDNVPQGKYNVSAAAPDGYNPTSDLTSNVEVVPGDTAYIDFGAQHKVVTDTGNTKKGPSPLLGIFGAMLLLGGVGLGVYAWRMLRRK
ncbi:MAG TPA: SdrD B-like domain-containing protein [Anaerolineales bacterium]|nr:SdrD B-like domain-containing protein [Anaerolineales bacterium]